MCGSKTQYSSAIVAENAREALSWSDPSFLELEIYECKFCEYFHLGHNTTKMTNANEENS